AADRAGAARAVALRARARRPPHGSACPRASRGRRHRGAADPGDRRVSGARGVAAHGSRRPRSRLPRPARIGLHVFLLTAAALFLLPLYVMLVTSVKPMEEIRLGNL